MGRSLVGVDLFSEALRTSEGTPQVRPEAPLAVRMRPAKVGEVVGQDHLLAPGSPLRRLVEPPRPGAVPPSSVVLWGPPGTGKTTIAYLIAQAGGRRFTELSAVTAGVKDVRGVVEDARRRLVGGGEETVLFVDEVHRFSKTQQDALLPSVENRWVTLVAATTENPSFSVISPLLSRSLLLTLHPLTPDDVATLVRRAVTDPRGLGGAVTMAEEAVADLVRLVGGDARKALTVLEASAATAVEEGEGEITTALLERSLDVAAVRYDRGDQHYDVASAFIKSMRGSDVDAALHYLARMLLAGEDPRFVARRIVIAASEEVGMADPSALATAVAAYQAVSFIGMPESQLVLAQAVVHVATAPKSNAVTLAIGAAMADVRAGKAGPVPPHLRDAHYAGAKELGHGAGYAYAHDAPHAVASQRYAPEELRGVRYYEPTPRGGEHGVGLRLGKIRAILDAAE